MLEVHLLGPFRLAAADHALPPFPTRASKLLFAYLTLHRTRAHSRERLCTMLAGNRPERSARKKLRQELWRVRQTLNAGSSDGSIIRAERDWISIEPQAALWIDAEHFEAALRRADACHPEDTRGEALLEAAYDLYKGTLLEGEYDAWCLIEQDRFRAMHHETAERLVLCHAKRRAWYRALRYARDVLRYDPLVESVHRQVMALLYLAGDRPGALRQFSECRRVLDRELAVEPMAATIDLAGAVKLEQRTRVLGVFGLESDDAEGLIRPATRLPDTGRLSGPRREARRTSDARPRSRMPPPAAPPLS